MASAAVLLAASFAAAPMRAYSQVPKEVAGKYANAEWGVEMVFPSGMKGMEMATSYSVSVFMSYDKAGDPGSMLMLNMMDLSKAPKYDGAGKSPPPANPPGTPAQDPGVKCDNPSTKNTTVSGKSATETVMKCSTKDGSFKSKSVTVNLDKDRSISLMLMASPASNFDKYVGDFDKAVKTLKIGGSPESAPPALKKKLVLQESGTATLKSVESGLDKGSHKVLVEISAGYTVAKDNKVTIDKKSVSGTLTIDKDSPKKLAKKLDVQSLSISADMKTIEYSAKVSGSSSDKVTGRLIFGSPVGYDKKTDQSTLSGKSSSLAVVLGKSTLTLTEVTGRVQAGEDSSSGGSGAGQSGGAGGGSGSGGNGAGGGDGSGAGGSGKKSGSGSGSTAPGAGDKGDLDKSPSKKWKAHFEEWKGIGKLGGEGQNSSVSQVIDFTFEPPNGDYVNVFAKGTLHVEYHRTENYDKKCSWDATTDFKFDDLGLYRFDETKLQITGFTYFKPYKATGNCSPYDELQAPFPSECSVLGYQSNHRGLVIDLKDGATIKMDMKNADGKVISRCEGRLASS